MTSSGSAMRGPTGDESEDFFTILGMITLTWAWAENGLAIMLNTIFEHAGPIKGHPEAPLSLRRRLRCFRAALRDVSALKSLQHDGSALAMRFGELGRRRSEFVHGAASHLGEGIFEAVSATVKGRNYAIKNHRFDIRDTVLLNVEIAKFCGDVCAFMARVDAVFA
jgi:hypothetical protein